MSEPDYMKYDGRKPEPPYCPEQADCPEPDNGGNQDKARLTTAVELLRDAKKTISTSRDPQGFALYVLTDLLTKIDAFLRDYDAKEQHDDRS